MGTWWINEKTGEIDERPITTDEIALEIIPQVKPAQDMYRCYRKLGLPILKAVTNVLHASIGEKPPFPIP